MAPALLDGIDRAIKDDRITALAAALGSLHASGVLDDPGLFAPPDFTHYARKLIWADPQRRFVVLGMTWAPGQGAPLHDHAGLWGGEIVVRGTMAETTYELTERIGERWRFHANEERVAPAGTVGMISPPFEYHALRNAGDSIAHTVHVYSGELMGMRVFSALAGGWYSEQRVHLSYDA